MIDSKAFHQLLQRILPPIQRRRANKLAEVKDVDVSADLVDFYNAFVPGHAALGVAQDGGEALERSIILLELGWLPPIWALPEEISFITKFYPDNVDPASLISHCFERRYKAAFEKFKPHGVCILDQQQLDTIMQYQFTPKAYHDWASSQDMQPPGLQQPVPLSSGSSSSKGK